MIKNAGGSMYERKSLGNYNRIAPFDITHRADPYGPMRTIVWIRENPTEPFIRGDFRSRPPSGLGIAYL